MRHKLIFWALVAGALGLAAIPSITLFEAAARYYRFLTGFEPGTLRSTQVKFVPHRRAPAAPSEKNPDGALLQFVEFKLSAPKAKRVSLTGDFAQWKKDAFILKSQSRGLWEILLPLPPGKYRYQFYVDGVITLDPKSPETGEFGDKKSSIKVVP